MMSFIDQHTSFTVFDHTSHIMGNKNNRLSCFFKLIKLPVTLGLEENITNTQGFIYNENIRFHIDCNCKSKTCKHTAGIGLTGLIDKISDFCKINNVIQFCSHLFSGKSEHRPIQINIFNSCIFHIETCTQFQKRTDLSLYFHTPAGRTEYTCDNFQ